jgi:nucleoside-diphosphate-sugar epimerase
MIEGKRILITGGAGFIGSSLALRIAESNDVTIFDNLHRNAIAHTNLLEEKKVRLVQGDVCDLDAVREVVKGQHHIIHMASIAGVDTVMKNPVRTMNVAMKGTMNILESCVQEETLERLIDFSTSEVFGRYAYKVTEDSSHALGAVGEARWTYAVAKLATEHLALSYQREMGIPACSIRPFNVYGPRQVGEGAIHHFIVNALRGNPITVHNDGAQIRSWCFVEDIVEGIILCMTNEASIGEAFNIGNPRSTLTIYNLAEEIRRLCASSSEINCIEWKQTDVELRIPNIDKANRILGFKPQTELHEGLNKTIAWYREHIA